MCIIMIILKFEIDHFSLIELSKMEEVCIYPVLPLIIVYLIYMRIHLLITQLISREVLSNGMISSRKI